MKSGDDFEWLSVQPTSLMATGVVPTVAEPAEKELPPIDGSTAIATVADRLRPCAAAGRQAHRTIRIPTTVARIGVRMQCSSAAQQARSRPGDLDSFRDGSGEALDVGAVVVDLRRHADPEASAPRVEVHLDVILDEQREP